MMSMAYMIRPWILMFRRLGAVPRVFVDDMIISTQGNPGASVLAEAIVTHQ